MQRFDWMREYLRANKERRNMLFYSTNRMYMYSDFPQFYVMDDYGDAVPIAAGSYVLGYADAAAYAEYTTLKAYNLLGLINEN